MTTNSVQRPIRVVVLLTLVVLAVVLLLASAVGASPSGDGGSDADPEAFTTYTVAAGDTLWDIASVHMAPGDDVRRLIFDIKTANDLSDSIIRPGQELRIPTG